MEEGPGAVPLGMGGRLDAGSSRRHDGARDRKRHRAFPHPISPGHMGALTEAGQGR